VTGVAVQAPPPTNFEGAEAVAALVLLEWTVGLVAAGAWSQSWSVVRRGHFRILGWTALALAVLAIATAYAATSPGTGTQRALLIATCILTSLYLLAQYVRSDIVGTFVGFAAAVLGATALVALGALLDGWADIAAAALLVLGAGLLGAVTNGMLLGHWYLNQPGLKPWALARLTRLALATIGLSVVAGIAAVGTLTDASTEGAVLGIPGFGQSFGVVFFGIWLVLVAFTGAVVWAARRCVQIKSIQSATGLYYVALLTAGVAEFLVRYLMVNAQ
jgi:hypothetical protein